MNYFLGMILLAVALKLFFWWCERGGGGWFGKRVRRSNHFALEDAIREAEEKVEEHKKTLPAHRWNWNMIEEQRTRQRELEALREKYPFEA